MTQPSQKFAYIDRTRGLAILMVVAVHVSYATPGLSAPALHIVQYGQMGVQLFFVASALTLCLSMNSRGSEGLLAFYIRRFFRIAPLYYLAIALYWAIAAAAKSPDIGRFSFSRVLSNVLFVHGFVPSANNVIVPGGWSIGTEMAFYVVFPFLFWGCVRLYERFGLGVLVAAALGALAADFAVIAAFVSDGWDFGNNAFLYFNLVNQLPVFLIGILTYFAFYKAKVSLPVWASTAAFVVTTGLDLLVWDAPGRFVFVVIPALSGASFFFLLDVLRRLPSGGDDYLSRIGRVSYSMYVFHFIFTQGPDKWVGAHVTVMPPEAVFVALFVGTTLGTYLIAVVSERLVEQHGRALGSRLVSYLRARPAASDQRAGA